ncbi:MAG TPA: outer membrane beta-barrel protein [Bradyrhizobium sp.]|jgi:opacity protein-like surface antigen|nr:outer membrane beta-barrel protein [Bradyrhizobium sp.]
MRRFLLAAVMFGAASGAQAADLSDLPILRGSFPGGLSTATRNWDGWYVGGQVDYTSSNIDLTHATQTMTNFLLRNSVIQAPVSQLGLFSAQHAQSTGFGAFVGRNFQWDDLVFGLEANYVHLNSLATSAKNQLARRFDNPGGQTLPLNHTDEYIVTLTGTAALQIKDVVTFRGRVGWATGNFLPYVFGGVAVGRLAVSRSVSVTSNEFDIFNGTDPITGQPIQTITPLSSLTLSQTEARGNNYTAGYTGGLGTEVMLFGNLFGRFEWEYVKFLSVKNMTSDMNSARLGIGYKF